MPMQATEMLMSAADQMRKSAGNLQAIRDARQKHDQEKQIFDIKKKKAELDLKESQAKGDRTAIENQMLSAQMKEYFKQQGMAMDGKSAMIDQAEHDQAQAGQQASDAVKQILPSAVAEHINPARMSVPGPQVGTVTGTPDAVDTPVAGNPNPIEPKMTGGKLGFERKPWKSSTAGKGTPSYNDVLSLAKDMAKEDMSADPLVVKIQRALPQAKSAIYGEAPAGGGRNDMGSYYKQDTPSKKDKYGFSKGETKQSPRGQVKYIGDNKWQLIK